MGLPSPPEGAKLPNLGCFRVWTDLLLPGLRPTDQLQSGAGLGFTDTILIEPHGNGGAKYKAIVMHQDRADRKKHQKMGFHEDWGQFAGT